MRKIISLLLIMISAVLLLGCTVIYYKYYQERKESAGVMEKMRQDYVSSYAADQGKNEDSPDADKEKDGLGTDKAGRRETPDFTALKIDWKGLKTKNEDVVAWIDIPGTAISYPVLQGADDEFYLHHTVTRELNAYGAIFLSSFNKSDFSDSHSIIYGHNMSDGLMFAGINKYAEKDMYESAPYIHIYKPGKVIVYRVFSSFQADTGGVVFILALELGSAGYYRQLEKIKEMSDYETGTEIEKSQPFITLLTCNSWGNADARTSLHAIRQKEYLLEK